MVDVVRRNWYELIPESARAPVNKKGKVVVEFAITKEGRVAGMQIIGPSGDIALDRAAYRGITSSSPFPPLPSEFSGQYVALRFHFYYNPDRSDLAASPTSHRSPSKSGITPTSHQSPSKSGITISIVPDDSVLPVGASEVVIASVNGTKNSAVIWRIEGSGCSGTACGTIDDEGGYHAGYHAPSALPDPPSVTLTAVSQADPTASASVTVHLIPARKP